MLLGISLLLLTYIGYVIFIKKDNSKNKHTLTQMEILVSIPVAIMTVADIGQYQLFIAILAYILCSIWVIRIADNRFPSVKR